MTAPKPPGFGAMRLVGEIAVRRCSPPNRVGLHVSASCLSRWMENRLTSMRRTSRPEHVFTGKWAVDLRLILGAPNYRLGPCGLHGGVFL
jgi:hypothetical protein